MLREIVEASEMPPLLVTLAVAACLMAVLWAASVARRDASIVDIVWGPGFALIALTSALVAAGAAQRATLVVALTCLWGLRLGGYLLWRNWGQEEDSRYQAMRRRYGDSFWWRSAYVVFGLQGALMWFISLPVQVAVTAPAPADLTWLDFVGIALFAVGFLFESVGDWQLARFKADPANRGRVMDRGLWAYTRHPNYFGDAVVWWGLFAIACATPTGAWTVLSPLVMTIFLMRVSGVTLLESQLKRSKPGYADYVRRVNAFFPGPQRPRDENRR